MIQLPVSFTTSRSVRLVGAGAYVPPRVVDNHRMAQAIPGWSPDRIEEKTSIRERRFLWDVDPQSGVAVAPPLTDEGPRSNTDMCEIALRRALDMAAMDPAELDAVFVVTCTPDQLNFSYDAMEVHRRLGCRPDCFALVIDDGCGGTPYVLDMVYKMVRSGAIETAAVIGSAFTSSLVDREVWTGEVEPAPGKKPLSAVFGMYVFGDGAGAVVLRGERDNGSGGGAGIVASMSGNDYQELIIRRVGTAHPEGITPADRAFVVNGQLVARSYPVFMRQALDAILGERPDLAAQVRRYYFHQPNKRLMDRFVADAGLPPERVACNVDRYGNTSAAGMLILLAEDLENGVVELGSGQLVVIAAVGANVHYGAQLIRL
jgi:3-oxoacyl-[acyl-carrier-protein] synthase III